MHSPSFAQCKIVAQKAGVKVLFSARNKLAGLCERVNEEGNTEPSYSKKHAKKIVKCCKMLFTKFFFSCKRWHVGQTKRCINDRLREHANTRKGVSNNHLSAYRKKYGFKPVFKKRQIIKRRRDQICEAHRIYERSDKCVNAPSLALVSK